MSRFRVPAAVRFRGCSPDVDRERCPPVPLRPSQGGRQPRRPAKPSPPAPRERHAGRTGSISDGLGINALYSPAGAGQRGFLTVWSRASNHPPTTAAAATTASSASIRLRPCRLASPSAASALPTSTAAPLS